MRQLLLIASLLYATTGCTMEWHAPVAKSPFKQLDLEERQTSLEIITLKAPDWKTNSFDDLWQGVDEFALPNDVRYNLTKNGFRVGVYSGELNATLKNLLSPKKPANAHGQQNQFEVDQDALNRLSAQSNLSSEIPNANEADTTTESDDSSFATPGDNIPRDVTTNFLARNAAPVAIQMFLHRDQWGEIQPGKLHEQWPLLVNDHGQLGGKTLYNAQGIYRVTLSPMGHGAARVRLIPEIQHGDAKSQFVADNGVIRMEATRPKQVYDAMAIDVPLQHDQTLIITCDPTRSGSMGNYFHGQPVNGEIQPKILLVRIGGCKYDEMFTDDAKGSHAR